MPTTRPITTIKIAEIQQLALSRAPLAAVVKRHRGALAQIGREANRSHVTVINWLSGKKRHSPVESAVKKKVAELLALEDQIYRERHGLDKKAA